MQVLLGIAVGLLVAALFGVSSDPAVSQQNPVVMGEEIVPYHPAGDIIIDPYHDRETIRIGNGPDWIEMYVRPGRNPLYVPHYNYSPNCHRQDEQPSYVEQTPEEIIEENRLLTLADAALQRLRAREGTD